MAVPTRPAAGGVVESAWGAIVHDTAVALDIQMGYVLVPNGSSGSVSPQVSVVFPRPFAGVPALMLTTVNFNWFVGTNGNQPTATGFTMAVNRPGANSGQGCGVMWLAIGPRA
jgi:hypothetical protein